MKIAICISGHLRNGDKTSLPFLKKYILDKYDCDIFVASWDINGYGTGNAGHFNQQERYDPKHPDAEIVDRILSNYNPKSYIIDSGKPEWLKNEELKWDGKKLIGGSYVSSMVSMFKKMEDADRLRIEYQQSTGCVYDLVIRTRFDVQLVNDIIDQTKSDMSCEGNIIGKPQHRGIVDVLFFGDPSNMEKLCKFYSTGIINQENYSSIHNGEHILAMQVEKFNIPIVLRRNLNFIGNFREDQMGIYWGETV